jgi:hypothetical protein
MTGHIIQMKNGKDSKQTFLQERYFPLLVQGCNSSTLEDKGRRIESSKPAWAA